MKTRNLLLTSLLSLGMLAACTTDDDPGAMNSTPEEGRAMAQIALTISTDASASTRAVTGNTGDEEYGDVNEYTVNDLLVVLADENGIAQHVYTPSVKTRTISDENGDNLLRVSEPFTVTPGEYYVYVLANYENSKSALSPIIANQTNMKEQIFEIKTAANLSTSGKFLMSNWSVPTKKTIQSDAAYQGTQTTANELGADGTNTETDNPEIVQIVDVDIERVVAKVTFNQTKYVSQAEDVTEGENDSEVTIATVKLTGVDLINYNKKMYMVVDKTKSETTNKPTGVSGKWYYPVDPNYDGQDIDNSTWLSDNFDHSSGNYDAWTGQSALTFATAKFYCPENTMVADEQKNGVTTGVVYRAEWKPDATNGYTALNKDGGDNVNDQKFKELLSWSDSGKDSDIKENIFTTEDTEGDFYTYADLIFKNKNAACLYKAISENSTSSDINTAFKTLKTKEAGSGSNQLEAEGIYKYEDGICYYPVWIKHNPTTTNSMEQGKYGVVRNHWYELEVTKITKLGSNTPSYDNPEDPDDPAEAKIQVKAKIKKWTIVKQQIEL